MKVTVESNYIVIRLKLCKPRRSKSGKSMLVASSRGTKKSGVELRERTSVLLRAPSTIATNRRKHGDLLLLSFLNTLS